MSKTCPHCNDAKDFYISDNFDLECGYCGAVIANVKNEFKSAIVAAKTNAAAMATAASPAVAESACEPVEVIDRSKDPEYYFATDVYARISAQDAASPYMMCISGYSIDNRSHKVAFSGRYTKKGKIRILKCVDCGHCDFTNNGRSINEFACDSCSTFYRFTEKQPADDLTKQDDNTNE